MGVFEFDEDLIQVLKFFQINSSNHSSKMTENFISADSNIKESPTELPLNSKINQTNQIIKDSVFCYHCNNHLLNLTSNFWENLNLFNNTCEKPNMLEYELCRSDQECYVSSYLKKTK